MNIEDYMPFEKQRGKTRKRSFLDSIIAIAIGIIVAALIVYALSTKGKSTSVDGPFGLKSNAENPLMSPVSMDNGKMCYGKDAGSLACLIKPQDNSCLAGKGELCEADLQMARIAMR